LCTIIFQRLLRVNVLWGGSIMATRAIYSVLMPIIGSLHRYVDSLECVSWRSENKISGKSITLMQTLKIQLSRVAGWDLINRFNPTTCLCLFQLSENKISSKRMSLILKNGCKYKCIILSMYTWWAAIPW
jgi:hypothetical protein